MRLKGFKKSDGSLAKIYTDPTLTESDSPADAASVKAKDDQLEQKINANTALAEALDGRVDELEAGAPSIIAPKVTEWLDANVNPVGSAVTVDSSLSVAGSAADAKKTGDELSDLKSEINEFINYATFAENDVSIPFSNIIADISSEGICSPEARAKTAVFEIEYGATYTFAIANKPTACRSGFSNTLYSGSSLQLDDIMQIEDGDTFTNHSGYKYMYVYYVTPSYPNTTLSVIADLRKITDTSLITHGASADAAVVGDIFNGSSYLNEITGIGFIPIYNPGNSVIRSLRSSVATEYIVSNGNLANVSKWKDAGKINCDYRIHDGKIELTSTGTDAFVDTLNAERAFNVYSETDYTIQILRNNVSGTKTSSTYYAREIDSNGNTIRTHSFSTSVDGVKSYTITTNANTVKLAIRVGLYASDAVYDFLVSLTRGSNNIPVKTYITPQSIDANNIGALTAYRPYTLIEAINKTAELTATYYSSVNDLIKYVTPEQYGAIGDGVTDDTVSVLMAISTGKNVVFEKKYYVNENIIVRPNTSISGNGEIILNNCSLVCQSLGRNGFKIHNINLIVTEGSTNPAIKIVNCFGGSISNITIKNITEFRIENWNGIEVYADGDTGGTSFITFSDILISGAGKGLYIYSDDNSYVTSLHFNNIVIERFSSVGTHIVGKKTYCITFNNISIDDNYDSGKNRYGIKLDYVSGIYFNNLCIWADARNHGYQFYCIYITDLSSNISPNKFYGYSEGMIDDHTITKLRYCYYNLFYQKVDSVNGSFENIGVITRDNPPQNS